MSAGVAAPEAVDTPRGQRIRTNWSETVRCYLEWHGFHSDEIHGGIVTYQRENAFGIEAAPGPPIPE